MTSSAARTATPPASAIRIVRLDDVAPLPWRNGGGSTRELLAWPSAAQWQWRLSVAEIGSDGPFSAYPGVQRCFAVLQGAGVRLRLAGGDVALTPDSAPIDFDGAAAPHCRLIDGPTRDLNAMALASAGRCRLQRAAAGQDWRSAAPLRAMFCTESVVLRIDGQATALPAAALAWCDAAAGQRWQIDVPRAWWLDFQPRAI